MKETLFPVFAILLIFCFVQVVLFLVSRVGGWRNLSRAYPGKPFPPENVFRFRSLRFNGWCGYNNVVTMWSNVEGVQFSMPMLFRAGHDPIFIPWPDITAEESTFMGWFQMYNFKFAKCPDITMQISKPLYKTLRAPIEEIR